MRAFLSAAAVLAALAVPTVHPRADRDTPPPAPDGHLHSSRADRDSVSITVYNQNFGLVREIRTLDLPGGALSLEFGDVASSIQPETVHIRPLDGGPLDVLEQNYRYDLLSPQKLLEKYVGRTVTVYRYNPVSGVEEAVEAEVLSVNGGPILRIGDEITFNYPGRFGFPELPDNLIAKPTLLWRLDAARRGSQRVEVSYLTNDLNWKADYVMVLGDDDRSADLTGWVTLTNQSGPATRARLKLVAGDVQRVANEVGKVRERMMADALAARQESDFNEQAFFEYHLYTLDRPADVLEQRAEAGHAAGGQRLRRPEAPRVPGVGPLLPRLVRAGGVEPEGGRLPGLREPEEAGLGMPLPQGMVRVYKATPREGSSSSARTASTTRRATRRCASRWARRSTWWATASRWTTRWCRAASRRAAGRRPAQSQGRGRFGDAHGAGGRRLGDPLLDAAIHEARRVDLLLRAEGARARRGKGGVQGARALVLITCGRGRH